jgi:hypothetical protein
MTRYNYAIRLMSDAASNGTGTLSVSAGSAAVTGGGTAFNTELAIGSVIIFGGITYAVDAIADATHLTLSRLAEAAATNAAFTYYALTNVEALTGAASYNPKSTYRQFTDSVQLANGKARGLGRPLATWRWGYIPLTVRTSLRVFCNNVKSSAVYLRTRTNEADAYETFTATILWPDEEDKQAGRRVNFVLEFKNLVQL